MTATNPQQKSQNSVPPASPLKVVPPTAKTAPPAPLQTPAKSPPIPTDTASKPAKSSASLPIGRWLMFAGICGGMAWVAQMLVSNSVLADAQLEPAPDYQQYIHAEIASTITEFLVKPGERVEVNDSIALLTTEEIKGEIADAQSKFEEVTSNVESALSRVSTFNSKVTEAKVQEIAIQRQVEELRSELEKLAAGTAPPEIDKISQEIGALQNNIIGLQSQLKGRQGNLSLVQEELARYEYLLAQGAVGQKDINHLRKEATTLISEIGSIESEIQAIESQKFAKQADIETVTKRKQEELKQLEAQLDNREAILQTAEQELEAAKTEVESRQPLMKTLKAELERQQEKQQKNQVLKAAKSGFVMTQDFHKLLGKPMQKGDVVLEIADIGKLAAIIEVRQEDSDIVKAGAEVTFYPLEPGRAAYTTRIEKVDLVMQPDPSQQKQLLRVRAVIDNPQQSLKPGSKVYARIEAEKIPVYEKVRREFMKVFNFRKYGLGG